jgi:hypothetical protein
VKKAPCGCSFVSCDACGKSVPAGEIVYLPADGDINEAYWCYDCGDLADMKEEYHPTCQFCDSCSECDCMIPLLRPDNDGDCLSRALHGKTRNSEEH